LANSWRIESGRCRSRSVAAAGAAASRLWHRWRLAHGRMQVLPAPIGHAFVCCAATERRYLPEQAFTRVGKECPVLAHCRRPKSVNFQLIISWAAG